MSATTDAIYSYFESGAKNIEFINKNRLHLITQVKIKKSTGMCFSVSNLTIAILRC